MKSRRNSAPGRYHAGKRAVARNQLPEKRLRYYWWEDYAWGLEGAKAWLERAHDIASKQ